MVTILYSSVGITGNIITRKSIIGDYTMSCIQNEMILESLFDEVCEEFPNYDQKQLEAITMERFEDMCQ